jgi:hypothetical protein
MIRLFQLLIFGYSCNHKWEWVKEIGNQWECRVLLQCEHCGKVKSKKTL